jgi:hypothetical protein
MKKLITLILASLFIAISFVSCQKEAASSQPVSQSVVNSSAVKSDSLLTIPYYSCGMAVNAFLPNFYTFTRYYFAISQNGVVKPFGIGIYGEINYSDPDQFSFEAAGFADAASRIPVYRIRRTDGKYLTNTSNGMAYLNKLTAPADVQQVFLLSHSGGNTYKVLLPKLSECNIAALYFDFDHQAYFFEGFIYNSPDLSRGITNITMMAVVPPVYEKAPA